MGRFSYRLQSILNIKQKMETLAKQDFAAAMGELVKEERRLQEMFGRKEEYEAKARGLLSDTLYVQDIIENNNAILRMEEYIARQENRVEEARIKLEQERQKLSEAMKERKIQENLREKAFDEFVKEENRSENLVNDELSSYRYGKKA